MRTQKETGQARHTHKLETAERGICQDTERNRPSEAHSQTGDGRGGTCQDIERDRPTESHPHPGDGRGRDLSGHRKKSLERGALTSWRRQREGLVKTQKDTDRAMRTHQLEMAEGGTCQDSQKDQSSDAHSLPGDGRGRDLSGHRKIPTERGTLTFCRWQRRDLSGHRKISTERGTLTSWRQQREGLVRTQKDTDRPRHTHFLEMVEGGTCQGAERNQPSEAHSLSGDGRGRDLSGHRKKPTDRGALTIWRR